MLLFVSRVLSSPAGSASAGRPAGASGAAGNSTSPELASVPGWISPPPTGQWSGTIRLNGSFGDLSDTCWDMDGAGGFSFHLTTTSAGWLGVFDGSFPVHFTECGATTPSRTYAVDPVDFGNPQLGFGFGAPVPSDREGLYLEGDGWLADVATRVSSQVPADLPFGYGGLQLQRIPLEIGSSSSTPLCLLCDLSGNSIPGPTTLPWSTACSALDVPCVGTFELTTVAFAPATSGTHLEATFHESKLPPGRSWWVNVTQLVPGLDPSLPARQTASGTGATISVPVSGEGVYLYQVAPVRAAPRGVGLSAGLKGTTWNVTVTGVYPSDLPRGIVSERIGGVSGAAAAAFDGAWPRPGASNVTVAAPSSNRSEYLTAGDIVSISPGSGAWAEDLNGATVTLDAGTHFLGSLTLNDSFLANLATLDLPYDRPLPSQGLLPVGCANITVPLHVVHRTLQGHVGVTRSIGGANATTRPSSLSGCRDIAPLGLRGALSIGQLGNLTVGTDDDQSAYLLSFNATGPSGTVTNATLIVPRSDVPAGFVPTVFLNGAEVLNPSFTETAADYVVNFTIHVSTDGVDLLGVPSTPAPPAPAGPFGQLWAALEDRPLLRTGLVVVFALGVVLAVVAASRRSTPKRPSWGGNGPPRSPAEEGGAPPRRFATSADVRGSSPRGSSRRSGRPRPRSASAASRPP